MNENEVTLFEHAVLAQAPPCSVVIGASLSPDGRFGAALTYLPSAHYLMDDFFERSGSDWSCRAGGSGGGMYWILIGESGLGVLRYGDEAPAGARFAHVEYEGQVHRVPVRHGHFVFIAWGTPFASDPLLLGFD